MKKPKINGKEKKEKAGKWIERINSATKYEKAWFDDAEKAQTAYTNEEVANDGLGKGYDYNITFANIETIVPAIINSTPIPDIRRRFADNDEPARIVADVLERGIRVQTDDNKLQIELEASAQDAFLAGRGLVRLRFYSDIVGGEPKPDDIEDAADEDAAGLRDRDPYEADEQSLSSGDGDVLDAERVGDSAGRIGHNGGPSLERVENERLVSEAVSWRDFRHGPAKRWDQLPWIAFRFVVPCDDEGDEFDTDLIRSQYSDKEYAERTGSNKDITGWEIWCRKSRSVYFVSEEGVMLKEIPDPLELTTGLAGFFPICRPIQPIEVNGRLKPVNPQSIYRKLADELDDITKRIGKLVNAMKVRGWYAGLQKELENVIHLDDNEFTPIADAEIWAQNGGVEGAIAFWPLDRFVAAIKELYVAREQTKQAIYEITGISDIVRGASMASETATAQQIKTQWGSLRIQKMQRMIERAARDLFVMMAELLATKFTPETLQDMTGIPLIPSPEMQRAAQSGDQEALQQIRQMQQVLALMDSKVASRYRIDVESDSTIRADLTRQKQEVAEFLQGAAAYFQAVAPLVQQGALPADAAVDIFASTARMFNLGKSVEDTLEKMVVEAKKKAAEPQTEKPDPEMVKAQMEQQKMQAQAQIAGAKAQSDQASAQAQIEAIQAKLQGDMAKLQADVQAKQIESQIKVTESNAKREAEREAHALAMQKGELELSKIMAEIEKIRVGTNATIISSQAKQTEAAE